MYEAYYAWYVKDNQYVTVSPYGSCELVTLIKHLCIQQNTLLFLLTGYTSFKICSCGAEEHIMLCWEQ